MSCDKQAKEKPEVIMYPELFTCSAHTAMWKRSPMGGAPYKPVKEGGGGSSFKCFHLRYMYISLSNH